GEAAARLELPRAAIAAWFGQTIAAEAHQLTLWLPVLFGAGVGVYFALPSEPPWWAGPVAALVGLALALVKPRSGVTLLLGVAIIARGLGAPAAQRRVAAVAAPVLTQRYGPAEVSGRVVAVELRPDEGRRIVLDRLSLPGLTSERTPRQVRI